MVDRVISLEKKIAMANTRIDGIPFEDIRRLQTELQIALKSNEICRERITSKFFDGTIISTEDN